MKNRRGAILVLAAFTMMALVVVLAFVIDVSRMLLQANQLQTGADAAAHAGAIQQLSGDSNNVATTATSYGLRNNVLGRAATFVVANVTCGVWDPDAAGGLGAFTTPAGSGTCGNLANAVQVTGTDVAQNTFQSIWGSTVGYPTRTAIAWSASITQSSCVKPWAVSYEDLTSKLGRTATSTPNWDAPLTATDEATIAAGGVPLLLKVDKGNTTGANYSIVNIANTGNNYRANISGCYSTLKVGDQLPVTPGTKGKNTENGLDDMCAQQGRPNSCWTQPGGLVVQCYMYSGALPPAGGGTVPIVAIGSFEITDVATTGNSQGTITAHYVLSDDGGGVLGSGGGYSGTVFRVVLVQ